MQLDDRERRPDPEHDDNSKPLSDETGVKLHFTSPEERQATALESIAAGIDQINSNLGFLMTQIDAASRRGS